MRTARFGIHFFIGFEKRPGQDMKVLPPPPACSAEAELLAEALQMSMPTRILATEEALFFELVCKSVYILRTNIARLVAGGDVVAL